MLQRKYTIYQGNIVSVVSLAGAVGRQQATHPVQMTFAWAVDYMCFSVALPLSESDTESLLSTSTEGRMVAAAVILVRSLLVHCRGPARWSHTEVRNLLHIEFRWLSPICRQGSQCWRILSVFLNCLHHAAHAVVHSGRSSKTAAEWSKSLTRVLSLRLAPWFSSLVR